MKELITESKREYYYTRLYIDQEVFKKQRIMSTVTLGALGLLISLVIMVVGKAGVLGLFLALFMTGLMAYIGYKLKYKELMDLAKQQDNKVVMSFPEFLQVFIGMIEVNPSGGVMNALKMSIPYIKNPVKSRVIRLVYAITADGSTQNVRVALQEFGQYVGSVDAIRILDMIYTMYVDGVDPRTLDIAAEKIEELNRNSINSFVEKKKKSLNLKSMPALLMGIGFVFGFVGVVGVQYLTGAFALF